MVFLVKPYLPYHQFFSVALKQAWQSVTVVKGVKNTSYSKIRNKIPMNIKGRELNIEHFCVAKVSLTPSTNQYREKVRNNTEKIHLILYILSWVCTKRRTAISACDDDENVRIVSERKCENRNHDVNDTWDLRKIKKNE